MIRSPTRHGPTRLTLLDPVLIRECSIGDSEIIDIDRNISDHDATLVELKVISQFKNVFKRDIWLYKEGNYDKLNTDISSIDWNDYLFGENMDLNIACEKFNDKFFQLAEQSIPKNV